MFSPQLLSTKCTTLRTINLHEGRRPVSMLCARSHRPLWPSRIRRGKCSIQWRIATQALSYSRLRSIHLWICMRTAWVHLSSRQSTQGLVLKHMQWADPAQVIWVCMHEDLLLQLQTNNCSIPLSSAPFGTRSLVPERSATQTQAIRSCSLGWQLASGRHRYRPQGSLFARRDQRH